MPDCQGTNKLATTPGPTAQPESKPEPPRGYDAVDVMLLHIYGGRRLALGPWRPAF